MKPTRKSRYPYTYRRWTLDDLCLLVEARDHQGYKWRVISELIPGTTPDSCQSRYYILKKTGSVPEIDFDEFTPTDADQDAAFCKALRASTGMVAA